MKLDNNTTSVDLIKIAMPFVAVIAGLAFCYFAAPVIVPVIVGVSFAYILYPAVRFLKRFKIPHLAALFVVSFVVVILFGTFCLVIYYQGTELIKALPEFKVKAEMFLTEQAENFRHTINRFFPEVIPEGEEQKLVNDLVAQLDYQKIGELAFKSLGSRFSLFANAILIGIIAFFIMLEVNVFKRNLVMVFGRENEQMSTEIMTDINHQISTYFALKFLITLGLSIVYTAGLLIMGIDYAYILGPLAGVVSLVPIIGAYAGAIPAMIVAGMQTGSALWLVWVFIFFTIVQFVESYVISPKLFGDSADLNLTTVMVSTILWGWMWGAIGVILAVPMTAAIKVICTHIEPLNPVAKLLEGKIKF